MHRSFPGEVFALQHGVSYTPGQLLAVVASRTVLVVDAPTDWSLAGPLWELALDDAPVDEILDVLVRRGIRTSPSFAIVRVEGEAVRALVRGTVPVCFERTGEPVRLDATGATTWLEGLISGATRVLVGDIEQRTDLPYLVHTGVVLVSGLALPTATARTAQNPAVPATARTETPVGEAPAEAPPAVGAEKVRAEQPVEESSPRVVDLTRSASRPAPALTAAAAAPAPVAPVDPEPVADELAVEEPVVEEPEAPAARPASNPFAPYDEPSAESPTESPGEPAEVIDLEVAASPAEPVEPAEAEVEAEAEVGAAEPETGPAEPEDDEPMRSPFARPVEDESEARVESPAEPAAEPVDEPAAQEPERLPGRFDLGRFETDRLESDRFEDRFDTARFGDDPLGTRRDAYAPPPWSLEDGAAAAWGVSELTDRPVEPEPEPHRFEASPPPATQVDGDDLLVNGAARGPSPSELPNFDPPSISLDLDHLRGRAGRQLSAAGPDEDESTMITEASPAARIPEQAPEPEPEPEDVPEPAEAREQAPDERVEESFEDYVRNRARDMEDDQPAALPFRVRGQTLRPEHRVPFGGLRSNNGSWPRAGEDENSAEGGFFSTGGPEKEEPAEPFIPAPAPALNGVNGHAKPEEGQAEPPVDDGPEPPAGEADSSDGLLLPAFFRGARAARSKTGDPVTPDHPAPVWARGNRSGERTGERNGERGPGGPLGLRGNGPTGLQPSTGLNGPGAQRHRPDGDVPAFTPPGAGAPPPAPPREPPRLLGVWCDAGHVTSPDQPECRVCGLRVPPQAPILVARPPLGVLIFDNGDRVEVDRPVVLGRDPKPVPSPDPEAPVLHGVQSRTGQVSRTHAEVRASGWDVVITDLDAMNGTTVTSPGGNPVPIEPGVPTVITSGSRADLGGESGFVFEVEG